MLAVVHEMSIGWFGLGWVGRVSSCRFAWFGGAAGGVSIGWFVDGEGGVGCRVD